jgi:hypothetical protein
MPRPRTPVARAMHLLHTIRVYRVRNIFENDQLLQVDYFFIVIITATLHRYCMKFDRTRVLAFIIRIL